MFWDVMQGYLLPTTNLGLSLGAKNRSMHICNGGIDKCDKEVDKMEGTIFILGRQGHIMISNAFPTYIM